MLYWKFKAFWIIDSTARRSKLIRLCLREQVLKLDRNEIVTKSVAMRFGDN